MISAHDYLVAITGTIDRVAAQSAGLVQEAAGILAAAVRRGGVIQAFGCGHSEAFAMELAGRAGGLVPTNRIALRDLVLVGDEPRELLAGTGLERDPQVAHRLYALAPTKPEDPFVIASNSGVNGAVVELALLVQRHGHPVVAVVSRQHTERVEPRHPSGRKLTEIADVVLDNGAPYGDAILPLPGGGAVGAVSSITAALLAQQLTIEVVRRLLEAGEQAPTYLSSNIPGGDAHNQALEARYAGRIRRTA